MASKVGLNARGESMAGACLVDDFDGDGRLDVFMPTTDPSAGASLLRNKGDGTFEDVSETAGLADQVLSLNARHADYDNDGDLDILMLRGAWEVPRRMSLLRNKGDGTFSDVTLAAGLARRFPPRPPTGPTTTTTASSTCTLPASSTPGAPIHGIAAGSTTIAVMAPSKTSLRGRASPTNGSARGPSGATMTTIACPISTSRT